MSAQSVSTLCHKRMRTVLSLLLKQLNFPIKTRLRPTMFGVTLEGIFFRGCCWLVCTGFYDGEGFVNNSILARRWGGS